MATATGAAPEAAEATAPTGEAGPAEASTEAEGTREERPGPADDAPESGHPDGSEPDDAPHRRWPRALGVLLALALLVTGAALYIEGRRLHDTPATANLALTDTEATARVTGDVSNALGRVFSYGPDSTAVANAAAAEVLAGKALQQYAALFGQVERQSADQKLTLTTQVVRAGVIRLTGSSARLLVFLDQVYERRGRAATTATAQLAITAELHDGRWRIVGIGAL
ncbi:hypothetical protein [Streptomyces sp. NPDC049916]|uniref:hypothetical protein n=1 Tax=Streptomyces sp. NPDC049916 TaxID=3155156 RepID=UPI003428FE44